MNAECQVGANTGTRGRLRVVPAGLLMLGAVGAFHLGFLYPPLAWLGLGWLGCLFALRRLATPRRAFYGGLAVGLGLYAPQLHFFWSVFGPAAVVLWLILAAWLALWLLLMQRAEAHWGGDAAWWLAPVLWLGLEYFRSELYPLRFSWFIAGSFVPLPAGAPLLRALGVYGTGALAMWVAAFGVRCLESGRRQVWRRHRRRIGVALLVGAGGVIGQRSLAHRSSGTAGGVNVAGIQLEFSGLPGVIDQLNRLAAGETEAELVMLSEYTLDGPPPDRLRRWCRDSGRWLVVGGKDPLSGGDFYNTAFVIDPQGKVVFQQAKSVPIQFFKDGQPARTNQVWASPWGALGICICYDLSYTRVVDRLVRQGARALLVPTMDVESWGLHEHELNARQAYLRAAEHGLPVFRVASSGISQLIDAKGRLLARASFPGQEEWIVGRLAWPAESATLPLDRYLVWPALVGSAFCVLLLMRRKNGPPAPGGKRKPRWRPARRE